MRHASFFSGVGGLDLGFERAGIETVSVCEIDKYASAVLAERFPSAPNLGSITEVEADDIPEADIWSGGFPCQDLSVAGKRAGFAGKRSSLAFTFLDLVEQRKPRWIVLENVPGLFSSNNGADFGRLLYEMEQLGYGVAWRTLDARYFGVAQRRRRVFLVGSLGSDRAGEVLLECEGCERHPATRRASWQATARGTVRGAEVVGALPAGTHGFPDGVQEFAQGHFRVVGKDGRTVGSQVDTDGVRAADGLARRLDNQSGVEDPQRVGNFEMYDFPSDSVALSMNALRARDLMAYQTRVDEKNGNFSLSEADVANSLSALWPSDTSHRSMTLVQAVIQDSREMDNKVQNGSGVSTEDISYTLTRVDRPAVFRKAARAQTNEDSETWVEGDVANTLNSFDVGDVRTTHAIVGGTQNKSGVSRSSTLAVFRKVAPGAYDLTNGIAGPNLATGGDVGGGSENIVTFSAHLTDASAMVRDQNPSLLTQGDAAICYDGLGGTKEAQDSEPLGLDSHRYRCCGNGVVANVAEWIGMRIVEVDARWQKEGK